MNNEPDTLRPFLNLPEPDTSNEPDIVLLSRDINPLRVTNSFAIYIVL
jgi:hypothetical protein